jgi:hypothetical protein
MHKIIHVLYGATLFDALAFTAAAILFFILLAPLVTMLWDLFMIYSFH